MGSQRNGRREILRAFAGAFFVLAGMSEAGAQAGRPEPAMLSADIGVAIRQTGLDVLLVQIREAPGEGLLVVHLAVPLRSVLAPGSLLRVAYLREADPMAAAKQGFNQWNRLDLSPGTWLVLAGLPGPGGSFAPVAGRQAGPPGESEAPLRRAVGYAAAPAEVALAPALGRALAEGDDISQAVLLGLASSDARMTVKKTVEALVEVFAAMAPGDAMAPALARTLIGVRLYDTDRGADAVNQAIVGALAARVMAGTAEEAAGIVPYLRSALLREMSDVPAQDAAVRAAMLGGIADRVRLVNRLNAIAAADPAQRAGLGPLVTLLR